MFAPAPELKILRRMNYISDQKGILRRYLREEDGWSDHLNKAGSFIKDVLQSNDFDHIVVLGSGWLLDFPIESILRSVKRISLVDVHIPPQIRRKSENLNGVEFIEADITGGFIGSVYKQLKQGRAGFTIPDDIEIPRIVPEKGKLVLSLNILNQLDILLVDYIRKKVDCDEELIMKFRRVLQESHVNMLQEHPFILMTDYMEILINSHGKVLEEKELIFTRIPSGELVREWEWQFDSKRLYNSHANTNMKVKAVFSKSPQKL